jgi:hypothetical protein
MDYPDPNAPGAGIGAPVDYLVGAEMLNTDNSSLGKFWSTGQGMTCPNGFTHVVGWKSYRKVVKETIGGPLHWWEAA